MRNILALLVLCLGMFLPGIASFAPTDRDESRYAQASRQMLASGDLVDIRFQQEPRYKKPIGIYWLQSAAATIAGLAEDPPIWVFRLVSVAGATAAVLLLYWTGIALFGREAALVGAIALAGIFGLAFEARIAKTDATLLACALLAQGALAQVYVARGRGETPGGHLAWLFWIGQGLGILVKGPIVPLLSLLTVAALALHDRRIGWLKHLKPLRGFGLLLVMVAPWLIAITIRSDGAFWQASVGEDLGSKVASGQESHGAPPGYFALTWSLYVWPFGFLAVVAGLKALNRLRDDAALRFCLAWAIPFWLVLELVPTKLPHYVIPAYPGFLLLLGWGLTSAEARSAMLHRWQMWFSWLTMAGLAVATLALVGLAIAAPIAMEAGITGWNVVAVIAALAAAWFGTGLGPQMPPVRRVTGAAVAAAVAYASFYAGVAPSFDRLWVSARTAAAFQETKPCAGSVLASAELHEPSLVFLAGTETMLTDPQGAARHLATGPCAVAAIDASDREAFDEALTELGLAARELASVEGRNYSNGRSLALTLWAVAE